jgi:hypothetical protein
MREFILSNDCNSEYSCSRNAVDVPLPIISVRFPENVKKAERGPRSSIASDLNRRVWFYPYPDELRSLAMRSLTRRAACNMGRDRRLTSQNWDEHANAANYPRNRNGSGELAGRFMDIVRVSIRQSQC